VHVLCPQTAHRAEIGNGDHRDAWLDIQATCEVRGKDGNVHQIRRTGIDVDEPIGNSVYCPESSGSLMIAGDMDRTAIVTEARRS
jgi:hypothetical protein